MATRSFIIQQHTNEKSETNYRGIYCHWDGQPNNNGQTLYEHYSNSNKLNQLIDMGDISSLHPTLKGVFAYHRDRGDSWKDVQTTHSPFLEDLTSCASDMDCEFIYLHDGKQWLYEALQYPRANMISAVSEMKQLNPSHVDKVNLSQKNGGGSIGR